MHRTIYTTVLAGLLITICFVASGCSGGINPNDITNDWTLVWGGVRDDYGSAVVTDDSGNVYVAGTFSDETSFDPIPGRDLNLSLRPYDTDFFLSKFNPGGEFQWSRIWGTPEDNEIDYNSVHDMVVDSAGHIYVGGYFQATMDFDPGEAVVERSPNGKNDAFLSKFDTDGNLISVLTWGSTGYDSIIGVETDTMDNIYITGNFEGTIDFDPGDGVDEHSTNGDADVFALKLDADGNFIWARTWGGGTADYPSAMAYDPNGYVLISGSFHSDTVDFDPGPGIDKHQSLPGYDASLTRLTSDGEYVWTKTWGSYEYDRGPDVDVDASGNIYVAGQFEEPMDVNPGDGVKMLYSNGDRDVYIIKFNPAGNYQWAVSWGGIQDDRGGSIEISGGNLYVAGDFTSNIDFDPGPGKYILDTYLDICLSCFNLQGQLQWVGRWDSPDFESCGGIAVSNAGYIFITGHTSKPPPDDETAFMHVPNPEAFLIRFPPYYEPFDMPF